MKKIRPKKKVEEPGFQKKENKRLKKLRRMNNISMSSKEKLHRKKYERNLKKLQKKASIDDNGVPETSILVPVCVSQMEGRKKIVTQHKMTPKKRSRLHEPESAAGVASVNEWNTRLRHKKAVNKKNTQLLHSSTVKSPNSKELRAPYSYFLRSSSEGRPSNEGQSSQLHTLMLSSAGRLSDSLQHTKVDRTQVLTDASSILHNEDIELDHTQMQYLNSLQASAEKLQISQNHLRQSGRLSNIRMPKGFQKYLDETAFASVAKTASEAGTPEKGNNASKCESEPPSSPSPRKIGHKKRDKDIRTIPELFQEALNNSSEEYHSSESLLPQRNDDSQNSTFNSPTATRPFGRKKSRIQGEAEFEDVFRRSSPELSPRKSTLRPRNDALQNSIPQSPIVQPFSKKRNRMLGEAEFEDVLGRSSSKLSQRKSSIKPEDVSQGSIPKSPTVVQPFGKKRNRILSGAKFEDALRNSPLELSPRKSNVRLEDDVSKSSIPKSPTAVQQLGKTRKSKLNAAKFEDALKNSTLELSPRKSSVRPEEDVSQSSISKSPIAVQQLGKTRKSKLNAAKFEGALKNSTLELSPRKSSVRPEEDISQSSISKSPTAVQPFGKTRNSKLNAAKFEDALKNSTLELSPRKSSVRPEEDISQSSISKSPTAVQPFGKTRNSKLNAAKFEDALKNSTLELSPRKSSVRPEEDISQSSISKSPTAVQPFGKTRNSKLNAAKFEDALKNSTLELSPRKSSVRPEGDVSLGSIPKSPIAVQPFGKKRNSKLNAAKFEDALRNSPLELSPSVRPEEDVSQSSIPKSPTAVQPFGKTRNSKLNAAKFEDALRNSPLELSPSVRPEEDVSQSSIPKSPTAVQPFGKTRNSKLNAAKFEDALKNSTLELSPRKSTLRSFSKVNDESLNPECEETFHDQSLRTNSSSKGTKHAILQEKDVFQSSIPESPISVQQFGKRRKRKLDKVNFEDVLSHSSPEISPRSTFRPFTKTNNEDVFQGHFHKDFSSDMEEYDTEQKKEVLQSNVSVSQTAAEQFGKKQNRNKDKTKFEDVLSHKFSPRKSLLKFYTESNNESFEESEDSSVNLKKKDMANNEYNDEVCTDELQNNRSKKVSKSTRETFFKENQSNIRNMSKIISESDFQDDNLAAISKSDLSENESAQKCHESGLVEQKCSTNLPNKAKDAVEHQKAFVTLLNRSLTGEVASDIPSVIVQTADQRNNFRLLNQEKSKSVQSVQKSSTARHIIGKNESGNEINTSVAQASHQSFTLQQAHLHYKKSKYVAKEFKKNLNADFETAVILEPKRSSKNRSEVTDQSKRDDTLAKDEVNEVSKDISKEFGTRRRQLEQKEQKKLASSAYEKVLGTESTLSEESIVKDSLSESIPELHMSPANKFAHNLRKNIMRNLDKISPPENAKQYNLAEDNTEESFENISHQTLLTKNHSQLTKYGSPPDKLHHPSQNVKANNEGSLKNMNPKLETTNKANRGGKHNDISSNEQSYSRNHELRKIAELHADQKSYIIEHDKSHSHMDNLLQSNSKAAVVESNFSFHTSNSSQCEILNTPVEVHKIISKISRGQKTVALELFDKILENNSTTSDNESGHVINNEDEVYDNHNVQQITFQEQSQDFDYSKQLDVSMTNQRMTRFGSAFKRGKSANIGTGMYEQVLEAGITSSVGSASHHESQNLDKSEMQRNKMLEEARKHIPGSSIKNVNSPEKPAHLPKSEYIMQNTSWKPYGVTALDSSTSSLKSTTDDSLNLKLRTKRLVRKLPHKNLAGETSDSSSLSKDIAAKKPRYKKSHLHMYKHKPLLPNKNTSNIESTQKVLRKASEGNACMEAPIAENETENVLELVVPNATQSRIEDTHSKQREQSPHSSIRKLNFAPNNSHMIDSRTKKTADLKHFRSWLERRQLGHKHLKHTGKHSNQLKVPLFHQQWPKANEQNRLHTVLRNIGEKTINNNKSQNTSALSPIAENTKAKEHLVIHKKKKVNPAFMVNGKAYRAPRLARPSWWVNKHLYAHIMPSIAAKFGKTKSRIKAEEFVGYLSDQVAVVMRRKNYKNYKSNLETIKKLLYHVGLIKCYNDYFIFIEKYLPFEFRIKAIPCIRAFGKETGPPWSNHINIYDDLGY